jgi:hypothetical protein
MHISYPLNYEAIREWEKEISLFFLYPNLFWKISSSKVTVVELC